MKVNVAIIHKGENDKYTAKGNYALETVLFHIVEKYFGKDTRIKFEDIIKGKMEV